MSFQVGQLSAPITGDTSGFDRAMDQVRKEGQKAARSVGKKFQKIGKNMRRVGGAMTRNVTLPIAAASAAIFKFGSDFEAEMSKITGLVGVASDQTKEWSTQIRDMAGEVGRGPKELAQAMFFVTSAGFRGAQAMEVLEMSAKAASAGLGETKAVADLVTSAINAYGQENISAARATDILTAAVREGKLEAETLAPVMGRLLPMANDLGIQFDELAGFMAAMSRTGLEATEASTALRGMMKVLVKPTQEAREQLEAVGLSFQDLRTQVKDKGLLSVLKNLQSAFAGNEEAMANVFPDVRGLIGVLNVLGQDSQVVSDIMDGVANSTGDMQTAFDEAAKTGRFAFNEMMSEAHSLTIDFFDGLKTSFIPVIKQVTGLLSNMRSVWRGMSDGAKKATGIVAGLAAAIGPAALGLGWAIKLTKPAVVALTGAVKTLTRVMIANPYLAVGAAIAVIATKAIRAQQAAKRLNEEIQRAISVDLRKTSLEELNTTIVNIQQEIKRVQDRSKQGLIPDIQAGTRIKELNTQLDTLIQRRNDLAKTQTFEMGRRGAHEQSQAVTEVTESVSGLAIAYTSTTAAGIQGLAAQIQETIRLNTTVGGLKEQIAQLKEAQEQAMTPEAYKEIGRLISNLQKQINQFTGNVDKSQDAVQGLGNQLLFIAGLVTDVVQKMRDGMSLMAAEIAEKFNFTDLTIDQINALNILTEVADNFVNSFGRGISNIVVQGERLKDVLKDIGKLLLSAAIQKTISILLTGGLQGTGFFSKGGGVIGNIFDAVFGGNKVGDALIQDNGNVVRFHPQDNILAMKAFGSLQPKSGMSSGNMAAAFERALDRKLQKLGSEDIYALSRKGGFSW